MLRNRSTGKGFTLPEVLVTVAIVAVLAAVVVPAVTQQVSKGDAPAFTTSVNSLRTAIASFAADVRKMPGELSQLSVAITTSDTELDAVAGGGDTYSTAIASRWRGPYESSGNTTGQLPLGFDWVTENAVVDSTQVGYLVVTLTKPSAVVADAVELDEAIDGGDGAGAGLIRWTPDVTPTDLVNDHIKLFLMSSAR